MDDIDGAKDSIRFYHGHAVDVDKVLGSYQDEKEMVSVEHTLTHTHIAGDKQ
jgi:hypothetical protein